MKSARSLPSRSLGFTAILVATLLAPLCAGVALAEENPDPPGRAARINLALGAVSLQPAGTEVWTNEVLNRPLATGDRLWSDREARAEVHVGSVAIRLGSESGFELLNIDDRTVQIKQTAGTLGVRVRALGPDQTFEIDTPMAALSVLSPGEYRIDIDDAAGVLRVTALSGQIAVTSGSEAETVRGGEQAEYSDQGLAQANVGALPPADAFDQWVLERDRREDRAVATRYVSRELTGYEDLDDYGSWQVVDDYGPLWTPAVAVGWAPYRDGHWAWVAPWGWTWVDSAPWGFAPFHYGRWMSLGGRWCWAPGPRRAVPVYAPALVGWVGRPGVGIAVGIGPSIGWFPLGWNEVYVPSYRVSPGYVRTINVTNIHVTNEYVTNYVTNLSNRPVMGAPGPGFRNQGIPGAVTATTRGAFTGAEPVQQHRAEVPREWLAGGAAATAAPAIAPNLQSVGRRAPAAPPVDASLWNRPVIARGVPPATPAFEAQRRAVIANGGQPVAAPAARAPRNDIVRAAPVVLPRPAATTQPSYGGARGPAEPRPPAYPAEGRVRTPPPAIEAGRIAPIRPPPSVAPARAPIEPRAPLEPRAAPTFRLPPEPRRATDESRPPPARERAPPPTQEQQQQPQSRPNDRAPRGDRRR